MVYPLSPFLVTDPTLEARLIERATREGRAQINDPEARVGTTSVQDVTNVYAPRYLMQQPEVYSYEVRVQFPDVSLTDDLKAKAYLAIVAEPIEL